MTINERLQGELESAMRSGDVLRRETVRMMRAALRNEEVARRGALDEQATMEVLQREVKKRQEALELYRKGGRQDLVAKAEGEISIISSYLPQQMSGEEIERLVREAIQELGANDVRQMGQVMKVLMPRVKGRADGKLVSDTVRALLSKSG
ncbi:MAG: GatB/YqeY domain-containing protein [Anaerolineae bacterium]